MAGLSVYSFDQYAQADSIQDILEIRLGDQITFNVRVWANTAKTITQDLTGWTFNLSYVDAIATFSGTQTTLASISNIQLISTGPQTDPNLVATVISPATAGQLVVTIPSTVTGMPAVNASIGSDTTLFKLIQMKTTFPAGVLPAATNILKPTIGLIVRYAF